MTESERQAALDEEHLKLLSIFYYISGGVTGLVACIPLLHVAMGCLLMLMALATGDEEAAVVGAMGGLFAGLGLTFVLAGWAIAGLKLYAAYSLRRRQRRGLCLVAAGITCLGMPYGTALGVLTFMVLLRDSVRRLFGDATVPPGVPDTPAEGSVG